MTTAAPSAARPLAIPAPMPFDAPVTTAVLPDNLFITFHPPNFPSTDVLANLRKETADRGGMAVVSLWRTFTGTGAHCFRANADLNPYAVEIRRASSEKR